MSDPQRLDASTPHASRPMATFGERLRQYRYRRLLTQGELGVRAGIDQRKISWWEKGRAIPRRDNIVRLAAALGVQPEELVGGPPCGQKGDADGR